MESPPDPHGVQGAAPVESLDRPDQKSKENGWVKGCLTYPFLLKMGVLAFCGPYVTPAGLKRVIVPGTKRREILLPRKLPHASEMSIAIGHREVTLADHLLQYVLEGARLL